MSVVLVTTALVVALLSVPSITAMGLAGSDAEVPNAFFDGLPAWRWWLMLLPAAAGIVGLVTCPDEPETGSRSDRLVGVSL